ncbi:MAG: hypothetical protein WC390_10075 [Sulfurimonas sp.]
MNIIAPFVGINTAQFPYQILFGVYGPFIFMSKAALISCRANNPTIGSKGDSNNLRPFDIRGPQFSQEQLFVGHPYWH